MTKITFTGIDPETNLEIDDEVSALDQLGLTVYDLACPLRVTSRMGECGTAYIQPKNATISNLVVWDAPRSEENV